MTDGTTFKVTQASRVTRFSVPNMFLTADSRYRRMVHMRTSMADADRAYVMSYFMLTNANPRRSVDVTSNFITSR